MYNFIKASLFIATNLRTPDLSSAVTILNIPKRNAITSKLIDLKADSILITLNPIISIEPISIDVQIGILNLLLATMSKYTNAKMAIATYCC
jgi:hypothetical protein